VKTNRSVIGVPQSRADTSVVRSGLLAGAYAVSGRRSRLNSVLVDDVGERSNAGVKLRTRGAGTMNIVGVLRAFVSFNEVQTGDIGNASV
jgi:hypothetical protein